jgi:chromosome segregation ATPase
VFHFLLFLFTGIRFQKQLRSRIKELVNIRQKHSKELNKWTKKCQHLGDKCQSIQDVDETIFQLLQEANSINSNCIKQNNGINEEFTQLYKSIPKKERSKSLKDRLEEERSNITRINGNLNKLEKQQTQLQGQLSQVNIELTSLSSDQSKKDKLKRQQKELSTQLKTMDRDIEEIREDYNQEAKSYEKKAQNLSKVSQNDQIKFIQSMRDVLQKFINNLTIQSRSSNPTTIRNIKPSKDHFQTADEGSISSTDDEESSDD